MSQVAEALFNAQAVFLRPEDPFTWASGIKSPIYCDNRLIISLPVERKTIVAAFLKKIQERGLRPDVIAGTATAGIPWAAWIADSLNLPMVYVRSSAKDHGRQNLIEGKVVSGAQTLLIEDLVSTGKSSLKAVDALKDQSMSTLAVMALFNYNLPQTQKVFQAHNTELISLCSLDDMLEWSVRTHKLTENSAEEVRQWRKKVQLP